MPFPKRIASPQKLAWRILDWCDETSLSRATVYRLMDRGDVKYVTVGKARRITTSPAEFLAAREAAAE